jgi:hypothetical protein
MDGIPGDPKELRDYVLAEFAARAATRTRSRSVSEARRGTPMPAGEYLTIGEAAALLKLSTKTIRNQMLKTITRWNKKTGARRVTRGAFEQGVHWFRPKGGAPRFKKSALLSWIEERTTTAQAAPAPAGRAYVGLRVDRQRRRA